MSISFANGVDARSAARGLVPLCAGAGVYLFFLLAGDGLLGDSDSFWHIKIGQWIIANGAMPYTDVWSFTKSGEPWISSSWLSQVLYAFAYGPSDWSGPVILASLAAFGPASRETSIASICTCWRPVSKPRGVRWFCSFTASRPVRRCSAT